MSERAINLQPILRFPRVAQVGRTYLLTVDVRHSLSPEQWPYEQEEYPLTCLLESLPWFEHRPLGEPTLIVHRFGGTYGEVRFQLRAGEQAGEGRLRLLFVNESGLPVHAAELPGIRVERGQEVSGLAALPGLGVQASRPTGLDLLLQASLPTKLEESKPVSPTLMIGIGGTGKEILLRLRRRIVERYGSLSMLPFLQFMHMDTDTTASSHEQYSLRGSDDPLHHEVRFKPSERVDLTIDGGTGKYVEHINNFPQIKRWFPTGGKIAQLGNLGEGAGQIRMAGRLGLFHAPNFSRIATRLGQCKGLLRDMAILQRSARLGFEFDPSGMNVFVIASLAGGTGSGAFLDVAFLLQRYFPNAERVGILLLPGFYSDYAGFGRVRANGYAALMELNHYSFGHSFVADWDGSRSENLPPPPFSTTYLIDGINESGLVIGSSGKEYDAYRMVAEVLFQDYSIGKFAGMKRATRINLVNFNLNVYTHNFLNEALRKGSRESQKNIVGDTYPTRFGSFGLATISFPTDRVHGACASRLAVQILDFWQKSLVENPFERLLTSILTHPSVLFAQGRLEAASGEVTERRDIEDALLAYDAGGGKTFMSYFWQKAQSVRTELQATPGGQKAAKLAEHRHQLDQFLAKEDSENPEEWGVGIRQVENNLRAYLERVKAGIQKQGEELSNNPQFGVAYTLALLRELKALLRNENFRYLRYFEEQIPVWRDAVHYYGHLLDQLQMDIGRHERQLLFRADDLKRDFGELVGDDGSDERGVFYNHYVARIRKQVAKRGKQACEEIDLFLGADDPAGTGLLGSYYSLLVGFENLKDRLQAKEKYFSKPESSEFILNLLRDGDVEEWYRTWLGEPPQESENLRVIGNQILTEIFQVASVTAALDHIRRTPVDEVEARILEHCRKFVASQAKQPEALALLTDGSRLTPKQREEMVRQAYRLSKVWLARSERGLEHTGVAPVRPDQRPCLIGVDVSNVPRLEEFKGMVREIQTPGDTSPSFLNIGEQNKGMIVFYNELAGVPAFYPSSVTAPHGLRAAYDTYPEKEDLHTDRNRFQFGDLIPKRVEEARQYADSLKALVLARLLGLLRVREIQDDGEHPTFHYSYKRSEGNSVEEVVLGDELHAVDYLYRDKRAENQTDRRILLQLADKILQTLREHRMLWVYALLLELYLKKVYPPREMTMLGISNLTVTQYSPEYAVLDIARAQIPHLIAGQEEQEQLNKALHLHRGKPLEEELTYEEFQAALKPYCKPAGKFPERSTTAVLDKTEWRTVWALDLSTIDKNPNKDQVKLRVPVAEPVGVQAPAPENPTNGGTAELSPGNDSAPPPTPVHEPVPTAVRQVECPTCYSMVDAGPRCPICNGLLEDTNLGPGKGGAPPIPVPAVAARVRGKVFLSYSHEDRDWLNLLRTTLAPLARNGALTLWWDDTEIRTGARWEEEIASALASSRVAVLLVSQHFLDSDYITGTELPVLLAAAERRELTLLWICVSPCLYQETPLKRYQAAHDPERSLEEMEEAERNRALVAIGKRIRDAAYG